MENAKGLEYEVRGAGEPVLLIHGSHVAHAFLPLMVEPALADRFRLVRYHRRGSGDPRAAVDAFIELVGGADWRVEVEKALPGAPEQAHRLSRPVLFLSGSASGPMFEAPRQLFLSSVPHAEDVVLPGLNHLLQVQSPGAVARSIADFLARHPL